MLCHAEEEQECVMLNEQVMMLRDLAAASPKNTMKAKDYDTMREDYEEQFGKFIPDSENTTWHVCKEETFEDLVKMRGSVVYYSHLYKTDELCAYFDAVDAFQAEYGLKFDVDDNWSTSFDSKRKVLEQYDELMDRADGDLTVALEIAVIRPFI
ncbi:hypothetical protein B0H10DRAFT_2211614 [Mycena sp. CBHHK59/15]|nr:hypothetical protein B0H10DRAFT_2211614 [Mycena sp. CBHHK59/15]